MNDLRKLLAALFVTSAGLYSGAASAGYCTDGVALLAPPISASPVTALACDAPEVLVVGVDGRTVKKIALGRGYSVVSAFLYPDMNGDDVPEVAVLLEDSATEATNRIEIVDVVAGVVIKRIRVRR